MVAQNYSIDFSWAPSSASFLKFSNCTLATAWMTERIGDPLPFLSTTHYVRDGLQNFLSIRNVTDGRGFAEPNDFSVFAWYISQKNELVPKMTEFVYEERCLREFCKSVGWTGNADIAGRGMLVNYIAQAVLVTLYVLFLIPSRHQRSNIGSDNRPGYTPPRNNSPTTRFLAAVQETALTFLGASITFSVAMLIAGIYFFADALLSSFGPNHQAKTTYAMLTSSFLPLYSLLPTLILNACISDTVRGIWWRRTVWILIAGLTLALGALFPAALMRSPPSASAPEGARQQFVWEEKCQSKQLVRIVEWALGSLFVALLVLAMLHTVLLLLARCFKGVRVMRSMRRNWWLFSTVLGFLAMWAYLAIFIVFRAQAVRNGGDKNGDREWTFGQVLGLLTWVPVVMEFFYQWISGADGDVEHGKVELVSVGANKGTF